MNKWRIGFWICLVALLAALGLGFYSMIDQGVTLTYLEQSYQETEDDLERLIEIINETDRTRSAIEGLLTIDKDSLVVIPRGDTLFVGRIFLTFKKDTLVKVGRQQ
ncbi:hypothetical protein BH09BAC3_BH09BAC3_25760 [soil metagenome]